MPLLGSWHLFAELYDEFDPLMALSDDYIQNSINLINSTSISPTMHFPFRNIDLGMDEAVWTSLIQKITRTFEIGRLFKVALTIFHPGMQRKSPHMTREQWFRIASERLQWLADLAVDAGTVLTLENIYDSSPEDLLTLIHLTERNIGLCIDTGHLNIFSRCPLKAWFEQGYVREIHIHDNHGKKDSHMEPGAGTFPFDELASILMSMKIKPALMFEPADRATAERGIEPFIKFAGICGYEHH